MVQVHRDFETFPSPKSALKRIMHMYTCKCKQNYIRILSVRLCKPVEVVVYVGSLSSGPSERDLLAVALVIFCG